MFFNCQRCWCLTISHVQISLFALELSRVFLSDGLKKLDRVVMSVFIIAAKVHAVNVAEFVAEVLVDLSHG